MVSGTRRNGPWLLLAGAMLLFASGCVKETNTDGVRTFQYETYLPLAMLLGGIVAAPAGMFMLPHSTRLAWGLMIASPILALFFAPSLYFEQTRVSSKELHSQTGIWGTNSHDVIFDEVAQLRVTAEVSNSRRGKKTNYYLIFNKKAGGAEKVPMNNDVSQAALDAILDQVAAHNIALSDETGGQ